MNSKSQLLYLQEGMMGKLTSHLQLKLLVGIPREGRAIKFYGIS